MYVFWVQSSEASACSIFTNYLPRVTLAACAMVRACADLVIANAAFATFEPTVESTFEPVEQPTKRRMRRSIPRKEKKERKRAKEAKTAEEAKRLSGAKLLHL